MLFNEMKKYDQLVIADKTFSSRLFTGTGKFNDQKIMIDALLASQSELVTMALKRIDLGTKEDNILAPLIQNGLNLLPNTSGARNAKDAVFPDPVCAHAMQSRPSRMAGMTLY